MAVREDSQGGTCPTLGRSGKKIRKGPPLYSSVMPLFLIINFSWYFVVIILSCRGPAQWGLLRPQTSSWSFRCPRQFEHLFAPLLPKSWLRPWWRSKIVLHSILKTVLFTKRYLARRGRNETTTSLAVPSLSQFTG